MILMVKIIQRSHTHYRNLKDEKQGLKDDRVK